MSFLSGLFGRTKYEPTTRTVQTVSKLPEEIAPYVTDILEDAQAQYDKAVAEGYQPYGKETIAPRTQEEIDAIAGLRSLIGGQGKYIDEAEAALRGIDTEFTAETAQKFMSPYQQAVTDIEKRKAEEDFKRRIMPEFERQAVEAGGMSGLGSRAGVQAALLGEAFSQQLGDIQTKGQQKAYEDAYRQFVDQGQRQRAQAEDLRGIGLLNGESPASVYSLYANNGDWYPYFAKDKKTQTSFKASGSADIGSHEFSFGFEFEQRNDSYWQFNGFRNIWQLMRQQANKHILELDLSNPIPVESNGIYQDTVNYPRLVIEDEQSFFDKKLRDKLIAQQEVDIYGNPIGDDTWIDVDAYGPSFFSLDMFSPDELLNNSSEYVFYYGYDIYGNKL